MGGGKKLVSATWSDSSFSSVSPRSFLVVVEVGQLPPYVIIPACQSLWPRLTSQTQLYLRAHEKAGEIRSYCVAHGALLSVMCQPGWEGSLGENGYMYMYD